MKNKICYRDKENEYGFFMSPMTMYVKNAKIINKIN